MAERLKMNNTAVFSVVSELLEAGVEVQLEIKGRSMLPLLYSMRDSVHLINASEQKIQKYDVVLFRRKKDDYVLHRVCKIKPDGYYMMGDGETTFEGPILRENIVALATGYTRKRKYVPADRWGLKVYARIWLLLRPLRLRLIILNLHLGRLIGGKRGKAD